MKDLEQSKISDDLQRKISILLEQKLSLMSPQAKEILEEIVRLRLPTRHIAKMLQRTPSAVSQALSRHGISKPRSLPKSNYSEAQDAILKEFYEKPKDSDEESARLRTEMVAALNAQREREGFFPVNSEGIRVHVKEKYHWPWRRDQRSVSEKSQREKELEKELQEAVHGGALVDKHGKGIEKLWNLFDKKLQDDEEPPEFLTSLKNFETKVHEIVWTVKALDALRGMVRHGAPAEKFREYYQHIPPEMIKEKMREFTGLTSFTSSITFLRGIGRLSDAPGVEDVDFQKTSYERPFDSGITSDRWSIRILNGVNLGVRYDKLIVENTARVALANARRMGDQCVIITNPIDLDFRQGGGRHKILRSLVSGLNTNIEIIDPDYRAHAKRILNDSESKELIYHTAAELFESIISGWHKVSVQPDGSPEFPGPVRMILGYKDELLIAGAAAWETRYLTILRHNQLLAEIKAVRFALARAMSQKNRSEARRLDKALTKLSKEEARTRITNVSPEEDRKYYRHMRTVIVKKIEEAIPNCKVIGQGTTFVKFGDEVIEFCIPRHARVTDTLLAEYTNHYGPKVLRRKMSKTVVICHPYALNYRETGRQREMQGKFGSCCVMTAPVCLDDNFLRDELRENISNPHPIAKLINQWQFEPGVLRLSELHGIVSPSTFSIPQMVKLERAIAAKKISSDQVGKGKYLYVMVNSDPHFGSQSKAYVTDRESGKRLGVGEAVITMMRRSGVLTPEKMPIHFFTMNDDPTQGQHFENYKKTDPRRKSIQRIERRLLELLHEVKSGTTRERMIEAADRMAKIAVSQLEVRGDAWVQDQMVQVIERHIQPNLDFFDALLLRDQNAGLIMKGRSDFDFDEIDPDDPYDARDLGFVDYGTGNHLAKSADGAITEGEFYARSLRDKLQRFPHWAHKDDLLEKLIKAPQYSGTNIGWGLVKAPGGYEWGLEARNSPPGQGVNWGDPLLNCGRNDERRGNYSYIFDGKLTLKLYGDKHFRSAIFTSHSLYVMGMPGTPTDAFGELGFPPNNTGVTIVGLPVDGPDGGPILIRPLHYDVIRDYFLKSYDFDWAEFLPNPV